MPFSRFRIKKPETAQVLYPCNSRLMFYKTFIKISLTLLKNVGQSVCYGTCSLNSEVCSIASINCRIPCLRCDHIVITFGLNFYTPAWIDLNFALFKLKWSKLLALSVVFSYVYYCRLCGSIGYPYSCSAVKNDVFDNKESARLNSSNVCNVTF